MGEFSTPEEVIHATEKVREAGYRRVNAYSPFPVEGLSEALGLKRNMVAPICLLGGLTRRAWWLFLPILGGGHHLSSEYCWPSAQ